MPIFQLKPERRNDRLDEVSELANHAVSQVRRSVVTVGHRHRRNVREQPQAQRYAENDRARLPQKNLGAINEPQTPANES